MAKNAQAEIITMGLKDEGGMIDEASGNEVPNGALKEEVRDDQAAMLSPGEFVIPAYAVRYIGVERLVKLLREAKQGMEQLDDIGLTGEPNADDAGLETAMLPSDMQEGEGSSAFAVGGLQQQQGIFGATLAPVSQQKFAAPTQQQSGTQQFAQPAAFASPAVLPSPLSAPKYKPTVPIKTDKKLTYPDLLYNPLDSGAGSGYGVAEYVGPDGKSIFVTTVGGKPLSTIPPGFKTRAVYDKDKADEKDKPPPTAMVRKKEEFIDPGTFEASEEGLPGEDMLTTVEDYTASLQALSDRAFGGNKGLTFGSVASFFGGGAGALFSLLGIVGNVVSTAQAKSAISKAMEQQGFKPKEPGKVTAEDVKKFIKVTEDKLANEGTQGQAIGTGTDMTVDWSGPTVGGYGPGGTGGTGQGVTSMTPAEVAAAAVAGGQNVNVTGRGGDSGDAQANAAAAAAEAAAASGVDVSEPSFDAPSDAGSEAGDAGSGDSGFDYGIDSYGFNATGGLIEKRKTTAKKKKKKNSKGLVNKRKAPSKKKKKKVKKGKGLASSK